MNYRLIVGFPKTDDALCFYTNDKDKSNNFFKKVKEVDDSAIFLAEKINHGEIVASRVIGKGRCSWNLQKSRLADGEDRREMLYTLYKLDFASPWIDEDSNYAKHSSAIVDDGITQEEVIKYMTIARDEPGYGTEWVYYPERI